MSASNFRTICVCIGLTDLFEFGQSVERQAARTTDYDQQTSEANPTKIQ